MRSTRSGRWRLYCLERSSGSLIICFLNRSLLTIKHRSLIGHLRPSCRWSFKFCFRYVKNRSWRYSSRHQRWFNPCFIFNRNLSNLNYSCPWLGLIHCRLKSTTANPESASMHGGSWNKTWFNWLLLFPIHSSRWSFLGIICLINSVGCLW